MKSHAPASIHNTYSSNLATCAFILPETISLSQKGKITDDVEVIQRKATQRLDS